MVTPARRRKLLKKSHIRHNSNILVILVEKGSYRFVDTSKTIPSEHLLTRKTNTIVGSCQSTPLPTGLSTSDAPLGRRTSQDWLGSLPRAPGTLCAGVMKKSAAQRIYPPRIRGLKGTPPDDRWFPSIRA